MQKVLHPFAIIAGTVLVAGLHAASAIGQTVAPAEASRPAAVPGQPEGGESQTPRASAALDVTIAELMRQPEAYAGRNVTVTSEVEEIITPWTAKLDEDQALSGGVDNDLLVIGALPLVTLGFDPSWVNKQVRATGTVRVLQAADFLREYGRGVDNTLFSKYEGKPALIATSLTIVDRSPPEPEGSSGASGSAGSSAAGGADAGGTAGQTGITLECGPSDVHCPMSDPVWSVVSGESSGSGGSGSTDGTSAR